MSLKFSKLNRIEIRKLTPGNKLTEHGITFERLSSGDGVYSVNVMVDGQRIHRVVGRESDGTTRSQAEEFIEKIRNSAKEGRLNLPKGRKTLFCFEEAAANYLKKLAQEGGKDMVMKTQRLKLHLIPFFGNCPLDKISSSEIERYKKERLGEKAAEGTINRELAVLSHIYNKAIEWSWIDKKPFVTRRFKEEQGRIVYLTVDQISRLLEIAKKDQNLRIYPFILIGLETAMRRMEILSIEIHNIDLHRRVIYVPKAKAGMREQPITGRLAEFLTDHLKTFNPEEKWLFPAKNSKQGHTINIEKPFRRVVQAAGLDVKQVVRHTLRHTAITHLVQAGVDLPTVKRISGHKTLQMVERYSHQNGAHIQAAMDKLERRYQAL